MIDVTWDPITPEEVPDLWMTGDTDVVKLHALAEALRMYYMYADYIIWESTKMPLNLSIQRHGIRHPTNMGKVKLSAP